MDDFCINIFELLRGHGKDIIEVIFWATTLIIAWNGLKTWEKQLKGTIEYELAKKILHRIYQLERCFNQVRNPFISAGELHIKFTEEDLKTKSESDRSYEEYYKAYKSRLEPLFQITEQLSADILEAEVLWGDDLKKMVFEIFRQLRELQVAVDTYIGIQSGMPKYKNYPQNIKEDVHNKVNGLQMGYFTEYSIEDKFAKDFELKIIAAEEYLKKYLKK